MRGRGDRNPIVWVVVGLWATSVTAQMVFTSLGREWVAPAGLNELGTAVVMGMLAVSRPRKRDDDTDDGEAASGDGPDDKDGDR